MTESITITRLGELGEGLDVQGNPVRLAGVEVDSPGWYVAGSDGGGEEAAPFGESDVMQIRIYNRSVVDVRPTDQVTIRGRVWKVAGDTEPWMSPFSSFAGTAVTLERAG